MVCLLRLNSIFDTGSVFLPRSISTFIFNLLAGSYSLSGVVGTPLMFTHTHTHILIILLDMIVMLGTSDRPCWLAHLSNPSSSYSFMSQTNLKYVTSATWILHVRRCTNPTGDHKMGTPGKFTNIPGPDCASPGCMSDLHLPGAECPLAVLYCWHLHGLKASNACNATCGLSLESWPEMQGLSMHFLCNACSH